MSESQTRERPGCSRGVEDRKSNIFHAQNATVDVLLQRLGRVQQSGDSWRACCPACGGQSRKLSVCVRDNRVLIHCFACNDAEGVLAAVGLTWADLMPPKTWPASADDRKQARRAIRENGWAAALEVLRVESVVVRLAGLQVERGEHLNIEDRDRLALACERIDRAALTLVEREAWKPDDCYAPDVLVNRKRNAVAAIRRQLDEAERSLAEVAP